MEGQTRPFTYRKLCKVQRWIWEVTTTKQDVWKNGPEIQSTFWLDGDRQSVFKEMKKVESKQKEVKHNNSKTGKANREHESFVGKGGPRWQPEHKARIHLIWGV